MKDYGFRPDIVTPDQYVLGAAKLPIEKLVVNGNWKPFLSFEPQYRAFETYNCTAFNTLNPYEMILWAKFGIKEDYSDRFVGIVAGTYPYGNSPHIVAEAIRKHGLVPDHMLPFGDFLADLREYYSFKGAEEAVVRRAGQAWLRKYTPGHEWVYEPGDSAISMSERQQRMLIALESSPLGVSVQAWPAPDAEGIYHKEPGGTDNHWTCNVVAAEPGQYWLIHDSYLVDGQPFKKLAWDYDFTFCKRYTLVKAPKQPSLVERLVSFIKQLFKKYE